ncbi:MAG: VWA domain-containing protein [Bacteroidaceae bacterium]
MQIYIILDTSGSMEGAKIGALNDCMSNIIIDLQEKAIRGNNLELAVLEFSRNANWMHPKPLPIQDFDWKELLANGMTSLGRACTTLSAGLNEFANQEDDIVTILLSDGCPTDDYDEGISILQQNKFFKQSENYAIALGEDADIPSLLRFTDTDEHIYKIDKIDEMLSILQDMIERKTKSANPIQTICQNSSNDSDDEWD